MSEAVNTRLMSKSDKKAAKLEKRLQHWKKMRVKGKFLYILPWVLAMPIIAVSSNVLSFHYHHLDFPKASLLTVAHYTIYLLLGFSIGLAGWLGNERRYLSAIKQQDTIKDNKKVG